MSVLNVLNDIKGDITPVKPEADAAPVGFTISPALEALQGQTADIAKKLDLQKLMASVHSSDCVSKELALEVFTMLPPMTNVANYLTSAPSIYNKSLVIDKVAPYDRKEELRDFLSTLLQEVLNCREHIDQVSALSQAFITVAKPEFERLNQCPPIVVYPGGKFNLIADSVERIVEVHDSLYRYEPYENKLRDFYCGIVYHTHFQELKKRAGYNDNVSAAEIYKYFEGLADYYSNIDKHLNSLVAKLSSYDNTVGTKYIVEDAFIMINSLPMDFVLFGGKDSIAEKLIDLLKFLK